APQSSVDEVRAACAAAREAARAWAQTPAPQRAEVLGRLVFLLTQDKEALAASSRAKSASRCAKRAAASKKRSTPRCSFRAKGGACTGKPCPVNWPTKSCSRTAAQSAWSA